MLDNIIFPLATPNRLRRSSSSPIPTENRQFPLPPRSRIPIGDCAVTSTIQSATVGRRRYCPMLAAATARFTEAHKLKCCWRFKVRSGQPAKGRKTGVGKSSISQLLRTGQCAHRTMRMILRLRQVDVKRLPGQMTSDWLITAFSTSAQSSMNWLSIRQHLHPIPRTGAMCVAGTGEGQSDIQVGKKQRHEGSRPSGTADRAGRRRESEGQSPDTPLCCPGRSAQSPARSVSGWKRRNVPRGRTGGHAAARGYRWWCGLPCNRYVTNYRNTIPSLEEAPKQPHYLRRLKMQGS